MANKDYLLKASEELTAAKEYSSGGGEPEAPYTVDEAIRRLRPRIKATTKRLRKLSDEMCPGGEAVAAITMHPQGLAKSYYPASILREYGLRHLGSRPVEITPEKWSKNKPPKLAGSTEIYVAGQRDSFDRWAEAFESEPKVQVGKETQRIEDISVPSSEEKLPRNDSVEEIEDRRFVEFVLHARSEDQEIFQAFERLAAKHGIEAKLEKKIVVQGLSYIPAIVPKGGLDKVLAFPFLRKVRPLPRLRSFRPLVRSGEGAAPRSTLLPEPEPTDEHLRVAVFDAGMPDTTALQPWVNAIEPEDIGEPIPEYQDHGHAVVSAVLFGPMTPGETAEAPVMPVDHIRVLDEDSKADPFELYDVLPRIVEKLKTGDYLYVNISVGPLAPMEDDLVHGWTAELDRLFRAHGIFATIAVGNTGDDLDTQEQRVQVPGDCINAVVVGAADSRTEKWTRAPYSSVGPGRMPGAIKPDVVAFGGSDQEPFYTANPVSGGELIPTMGSSFAAPALLRQAVRIQHAMGDRVSRLAIRALLIHHAAPNTQNKDAEQREIGWGRVPEDISEILTCREGEASILYEGVLQPGKSTRVSIPMPLEPVDGMVKLKATIVFLTETDPQDPGNYTRAGLSVTFRPHSGRRADNGIDAKTEAFFKKSPYEHEQTLRQSSQVWEPVMKAEKRKKGENLHQPRLDIHYRAREHGGNAKDPSPIPYALVISVEAEEDPQLYGKLLQAYAGRVQPLVPVTAEVETEIELPD